MVPSPIPEGAPLPRPRAYLKCTTLNLKVRDERVERGAVAKVFHGDEVLFFSDPKTNERLGFRLYLADIQQKEHDKAKDGDETTEAEKSSSSENCDSDTFMNS